MQTMFALEMRFMMSTTMEKHFQTLAEPARASGSRPRFHVVLFDDDDHTVEYVIGMLRRLFGFADEEAMQLAMQIDASGKVVVETTSQERAEFKRDQITAFGRDWRLPRCEGSMTAVIEPAVG